MKIWLTVLFALWTAFAHAQSGLEVIELRSRGVDEVLPVLQPLLEPGGTLTGMNNQLFLRASPKNRAEIKKALAALDKPARQLIIRISQNRQADDEAQGVSGSGQVVLGSTSRARGEAQVWDTRSARRDSGGQMVRVQEGSQAFIQIGRSLPVPMRQVIIGPGGAVVNETVVYQDIGQGFYAQPRLNGERVSIDISQRADALHGRSGVIDSQRLTTTVAGRLGEWIELGGAGRQATTRQSGTLNLSTSDVRDQRAIWLKVEEVE
jgi:type II secretory pathway component GspD/PulD (secretin)